jgi:hypothetical protein
MILEKEKRNFDGVAIWERGSLERGILKEFKIQQTAPISCLRLNKTFKPSFHNSRSNPVIFRSGMWFLGANR